MPICGSSELAYFYFRDYSLHKAKMTLVRLQRTPNQVYLVVCRFRFFFLPFYLRVFGNIYFILERWKHTNEKNPSQEPYASEKPVFLQTA